MDVISQVDRHLTGIYTTFEIKPQVEQLELLCNIDVKSSHIKN